MADYEVVWNGVNDGRDGDLLVRTRAQPLKVHAASSPRLQQAGDTPPTQVSAARREAWQDRGRKGIAKRRYRKDASQTLRDALSSVVFQTIPQLVLKADINDSRARRVVLTWYRVGDLERRPLDSLGTRFEYRLSARAIYARHAGETRQAQS